LKARRLFQKGVTGGMDGVDGQGDKRKSYRQLATKDLTFLKQNSQANSVYLQGKENNETQFNLFGRKVQAGPMHCVREIGRIRNNKIVGTSEGGSATQEKLVNLRVIARLPSMKRGRVIRRWYAFSGLARADFRGGRSAVRTTTLMGVDSPPSGNSSFKKGEVKILGSIKGGVNGRGMGKQKQGSNLTRLGEGKTH